jgi:hypothetical protein
VINNPRVANHGALPTPSSLVTHHNTADAALHPNTTRGANPQSLNDRERRAAKMNRNNEREPVREEEGLERTMDTSRGRDRRTDTTQGRRKNRD